MRFPIGTRATAVVALLSAAPPAAQSPATPTPASCTVSGDVVDESSQPVSGITVVVFPTDQQQWPGARESMMLQWSRPEPGGFTFAGLPAGSYRLNVTRDDFGAAGPDPAQLPALQRRAFPVPCANGEGRRIRLIVNDSREIVRAAMSAGEVVAAGRAGAPTLPSGTSSGRGPALPPRPTGPGEISGTVFDAEGRPVAGAVVQRLIRIVRDGTPQLARSGDPVTTDDHGAYRLTGLVAGQFFVAVMATTTSPGTGRLATLRTLPPAAVDPAGHKTGYVTTFYPETDDPLRADFVVVGATAVRGVDVRLQARPLTDVRGMITGWSGSVFDAHAVLLPMGDGLLAGAGAIWCSVGTDGAFAFTDLPLGDYVFSYENNNGWARQPVKVANLDGEALTISLHPPIGVRGHVEFLGDTPVPTGRALEGLRVRLWRENPLPGSRSVETAITPDGGFVASVAAGQYRLQTRSTPPWTEVSGAIGGIDTLDQPVEITADRDDAVVVFVDRETTVSGTVRDEASGQNAAFVVVYPADQRYWTPQTRRARVVDVVPGGAFSLAGLPPGRYVAVALAGARPILSPTLFRSFLQRGQTFDLTAREHRELTLTISRDR